MQTRAMKNAALRPSALYLMYDHLQHAAVKAGVPKEDLRQQLWNECVQKYIYIFIGLLTDQPPDSDVIPSSPHRPLVHRLKRRWFGSNTKPSQWIWNVQCCSTQKPGSIFPSTVKVNLFGTSRSTGDTWLWWQNWRREVAWKNWRHGNIMYQKNVWWWWMNYTKTNWLLLGWRLL